MITERYTERSELTPDRRTVAQILRTGSGYKLFAGHKSREAGY